MHRGPDGRWWPDWAEPEPDPPPAPTGAWVSWHLGWWWSTTIDLLDGRRPAAREDVDWPGDAESTATWLRRLRERWSDVLEDLGDRELDAPAPFP